MNNQIGRKIQRYLSKMSRIPVSSKIFFLQNLSVMIKAGIPLAESIKTLEAQTKNKKLKIILTDISSKIEGGATLAEGLELYINDFGELFVNMIKAGETSGRLEEVLHELYIQTKKDHELLVKVRNALTYPTIIIIAMLGIGIFVLFFVLPNITSLFSELEVELPLPTKILIAIGKFTEKNGLFLIITLAVFLLVFIKLLRTEKGKKLSDLIFLKTPILSSIIKKINLARMSRGLSSLIKTDIPIVDTLRITSQILGNYYYRQALAEASEKIKEGEKLEIIFRDYPEIFPPIIIQMIAVGETTGALDEILENLAKFYEEDVFQTMNSLPSIIEPILMLLIGVCVAGVALAVLMPIFSLTQSI